MLLYSDLPSGLPAEIADLRPLDIRSTEKPTKWWQPHASSLSCHSKEQFNIVSQGMQAKDEKSLCQVFVGIFSVFI